ncbi:hypothetical protein AJ79_03431 [Helicocarpus griseus UAMH5409]|uniref:USP domain-containing protein n=1 Tax=Helicocarpus griseus UAMH5409 TaxID=1447875 RepID=A0A2B7XYN1_9EURO|nr:hypothetical protein AJ79_03431 [Helicocarpus griseus UAMH5409]
MFQNTSNGFWKIFKNKLMWDSLNDEIPNREHQRQDITEFFTALIRSLKTGSEKSANYSYAQDKLQYGLFSVIAHIGPNIYEGRYITIVKEPSGRWVKIDGENVTEVDFEEIGNSNRCWDESPHVLFYSKLPSPHEESEPGGHSAAQDTRMYENELPRDTMPDLPESSEANREVFLSGNTVRNPAAESVTSTSERFWPMTIGPNSTNPAQSVTNQAASEASLFGNVNPAPTSSISGVSGIMDLNVFDTSTAASLSTIPECEENGGQLTETKFQITAGQMISEGILEGTLKRPTKRSAPTDEPTGFGSGHKKRRVDLDIPATSSNSDDHILG